MSTNGNALAVTACSCHFTPSSETSATAPAIATKRSPSVAIREGTLVISDEDTCQCLPSAELAEIILDCPVSKPTAT